MDWMPAVESRDQLVLFPRRLDDVLPEQHPARLLVEILEGLDWSDWEAEFSRRGPGRPPFHPSVLASVLIYGLLNRIRASRQLEEAVFVRLDFRWIVEGRSIDHSTLSEFRRKYGDHLRKLFVRIGLVARAAGLLKLEELAFDGTKVRANNSRSAKQKTSELRRLRDELQKKYDESAAEAERLDREAANNSPPDDSERRALKAQLEAIKRANEELDRIERDGETPPQRIPTTDPDSRVTKNKEGGFAPNYTPVVAVDTESGFVVATEMIANTDEKSVVAGALDTIKEDFNEAPKRVLADGIYGHGTLLEELDERKIDFYSPGKDLSNNPAIRDDPRQAVPEEQWDRLPYERKRKRRQLSKDAFIYDAEEDVYYCPQGQPLNYTSTTRSVVGGQESERRRYRSSEVVCAGCPLRQQCILSEKTQRRQVMRDQYEHLREKRDRLMNTPEGQETYARRRTGERQFADIKQHMGLRQFLTRGMQTVHLEWLWALIAFNLKCLMSMKRARAGPPLD